MRIASHLTLVRAVGTKLLLEAAQFCQVRDNLFFPCYWRSFKMELSIEPPCQHVTWKIRDFFKLPSEKGFSLDSPEFRFANDIYCLRLYPNGDKYGDTPDAEIELVRLTSTLPERDVICKLGCRFRVCTGEEFHEYLSSSTLNKNLFMQFQLEAARNMYAPDGTITVVCSMHLREQSSSGNPQSEEADTSDSEEKQGGLTGQNVFFSSRWRPFKMELSVESPFQNVTWKVRDFFQLPSEIGYSLESPAFRFSGDKYCLRLYPNGNRNGDTTDIHVQLVRLTSTFPERIVLCKVGCRGCAGRELFEFDRYLCSGTLNDEFRFFPSSRSELEDDRDTYIPDGTFTVVCFMRLGEQSCTSSPQPEEVRTSEVEDEQERLPGMAKLRSDYRRLLQKGAENDACLVVSGKEFRAHRCVLRARSAVFDAMFDHETTEKESGRVVIDDLDPESFGDFLEYLYTGSVGAGFSDDNVFGLYAAADKYDMPTLKSECVAHMRKTLSADSFCDVMTLALRHDEEDLLQQAIQFFKQNMQSIILTAKWQQFVIDNGTSANELFIKALVPGR